MDKVQFHQAPLYVRPVLARKDRHGHRKHNLIRPDRLAEILQAGWSVSVFFLHLSGHWGKCASEVVKKA